MKIANPKIIHRIYFPNFKPYKDPFEHYLASWIREMPDYQVMRWSLDNLDVYANAWVKKAYDEEGPVFLSEYFRWQILSEYGGLYLDADCEILDGRVLASIVEELYQQDQYDCFFGVEEFANGHPTAQTIGAKPTSKLVKFMKEMYETTLSGALWHWREKRGLIGPQLMSLFYLEHGHNLKEDGFFKGLTEPLIVENTKVYPQVYFSPKFTITGSNIAEERGKTCVYHLFANSNVIFANNSVMQRERERALTFAEYKSAVEASSSFPQYYGAADLFTIIGSLEGRYLTANRPGILSFGPYIQLRKGQYVVTFLFQRIESSINVSVVNDQGRRVFNRRQTDKRSSGPVKIELDFFLDADASQVEFVTETTDDGAVHLEAISLAEGTLEPARPDLKVIHRIYFGFDGKKDPYEAYLKTWNENLPGFKILHWHAGNLPMAINPYVIKLYAEKDHAFLTDFFRWYLLREYGGVYLDADVEVTDGLAFNRIIEELQDAKDYEAIIGIDEKQGGWYTAHSMASKPQSHISKFMCDLYGEFGKFVSWRKKGLYFWAPQLTALFFADRGFNMAGMGTNPNMNEPQIVESVKVYPQDYFSPISPSGQSDKPFNVNGLTANTCLCHHFACSWHDNDSIYLAHAMAIGGQSGALLRDVVQRIGCRSYSSGELFSLVGERSSQDISTNGQTGYLMFGPYIPMLTGVYRLTWRFSDLSNLDGALIDVCANKGIDKFVSFLLADAPINELAISIDVVIDRVVSDFECRVFVEGGTRLSIRDLNIEKLSSFDDATSKFLAN